MDQNQPAPISAMDSSQVSSPTVCFGQFKVDSTSSGDGPINRVPNEIMQLIMAKLKLDGDVRKLIRLRLVCTRWRAMVEDYCRLKKSLFVEFQPKSVSYDYASYFERRFFGFANFKNFTCLFLSSKIPSKCLSSFLSMFPNIEQLFIERSYYYHYNECHLNSLQVYIMSLDSLKLLDLRGQTIEQLLSQLSSVLSKLQHFSYDSIYPGHKDDHLQVISHLGQGCVRINFGQYFVYDQVRQWHNNNPLWLASLTHLPMRIHGTSEDCARVVHLLSEHTNLLQYLDFHNTSHNPLTLTPTVLEDLGKLTHLTKLAIYSFKIPFSELEQSALQHRLTSITSVLTCKLRAYIGGNSFSVNGDQFTRVLSAIFPNLVEFQLTFVPFGSSYHVANARGQVLKHQIEQHWDRFPNLRKHNIKVL